MAIDLGQIAGGFTAQWDTLSRAQREQELVNIKREQANREKSEYERIEAKRDKMDALGEIANDPMGGYASSTSLAQLKSQYPDQPIHKDGQLTQYGTALIDSVKNGTGVSFRPKDKAVIDELGSYAKLVSTPQGIQDPSQPPPENPLGNFKVVGSRIVNSNFNPEATHSVDDQKMYVDRFKKALVDVYKFSDNPEDILKADKIMRDKKFEENSNNFLDAKRAIAMGDDKGALVPLNNLMSNIMPGVKVGGLVRDKNGQLASVTDDSGKPIPVNMKELGVLMSSNNLMAINEYDLKVADSDSKRITANAETLKGSAAILKVQSEAPYFAENANSLKDSRESKAANDRAILFGKQVKTALGIPDDPTKLFGAQKDLVTKTLPVIDDLYQASTANGLKLTGAQASNIAQGLNGMPQMDSKGKPVKDKDGKPVLVKTYNRFINENTPDGMVEVKDLSTKRVVAYLPRGANEDAIYKQSRDAANNPAPSARVETPQQAPAPAPAKGLKVDTTKYVRSKNNKGGYTYTESARGLTKAQFQEIDAEKNK